jgi:hypothetical protein
MRATGNEQEYSLGRGKQIRGFLILGLLGTPQVKRACQGREDPGRDKPLRSPTTVEKPESAVVRSHKVTKDIVRGGLRVARSARPLTLIPECITVMV